MYGNTINKYCIVCKEEIMINVSMCLMGPAKTEDSPGEEYYVRIYCPKCNNHLSKVTEEEIRKLEEKGVKFAVCMLQKEMISVEIQRYDITLL